MKIRHAIGLAAAVSTLALVACSTAEQVASSGGTETAAAASGPPVETRSNNQAGYQPAFVNQTRAPAMMANAPVEVREYVPSGIASPFSFEFLPDGNVLITERAAGQFKIADKSGKIIATIKDGVPPVASRGQGGLLDVALDPKFSSNNMIYWSFSEPQPDNTNNTAVAKAKLVQGANPHLENVQVIYHQTPSLNSALHFGSRIVFAKDGTMFVTQGERSILPGRVQAQDLKSGLGKIVRINTDGTIPKDNPFVGRADARPEIWSYGHRNVQGAFLHPKTGELWEFEHGPQGGDEINIAKKGHDFGWPTITYGVEYGPARTKIGDVNGAQQAGMDQPVYYFDPVMAPGGMTYYDSNAIPKWKGSIFVSGLDSYYITRLTMNSAGDKVIGEERFKPTPGPDRYRDIGVGPDGALYVLTDGPSAKLLRIGPSASGQNTLVAWTTDAPSRVNSTTIARTPATAAPPPRAAATPASAAAAGPASPPVLVGGPAAEPPTPDASSDLLATITMPAKNKLTVTTPGWANNADIPYEYTQYRTNTFPGLRWTKGPASTKSYAIIMQDSGMLIRGGPVLHWTLVNIPAGVTKLDKGMAPDGNPKGSIYGPNYQGTAKPYLGPRTPAGPKHRYHMQVLALDVMLPADFAPKTYDELIAPMKGHVVASGDVIGLGQADPNAPPPAPRATPAPAAVPVTPSPETKAAFDANCGICHATGENGAALTAALARLEAPAVLEKVTTGSMAGFASALSAQQKRDIAEFVTGKKLPQ